MKKFIQEDYSFCITVTDGKRNANGAIDCRNGHEVGDTYRCEYGCPAGFCAKSMLKLFPLLEVVRSGGDLRRLGGSAADTLDFSCPDGVVTFRLQTKEEDNPVLLEGSGENVLSSDTDMICHYDALIEENNDPFFDPAPLRKYMDQWDGPSFIDELCLTRDKEVLEIGVGTGRLAVKIAPYCNTLTGIDLSPKTIERAAQNLSAFSNVTLLCGDFVTFCFDTVYDLIYSSLTFMHFSDKQAAISKAAGLLKPSGRFVLSIDKNQSDVIECNGRRIRVYPDLPEETLGYINNANLILQKRLETEFAYIFTAVKSVLKDSSPV